MSGQREGMEELADRTHQLVQENEEVIMNRPLRLLYTTAVIFP